MDILAVDTTEENLYDLAELFKVFGDSTRIQIMYVLLNGEMSVGDIAEKLNMNTSAISHQLRVLKQAKLIKNRRAGKNIFYSLADEHVVTIMKQGMDHILE
ncbi:MAG: ArsR/SmtB family transcription factor [Coprococcus sp.]